MSVINSIPLIAAGDDGYQISRSVRTRKSATGYFSRTPASASNRKTWTLSKWVKFGDVSGSIQSMFGTMTTSNYTIIGINSAGQGGASLTFESISGTTTIIGRGWTNAVYRDPSAWYHIVFVLDTTQAVSTDRVKIYVNGVLQSLSSYTAPAQNSDHYVNQASVSHALMGGYSTGYTTDGYLTEVNFIDGQALTPSSFGETDAVTGVWKPKKYAGTYGTNGFYLNFSDPSAATAAAIGKDNSGNGNNWTPNNISVTAGATYDSMLDVPTMWADGGNGRGNYCVLNPVWKSSSASTSNANLTLSQTAALDVNQTTMGVSSGKWYWEATVTSVGATPVPMLGVVKGGGLDAYTSANAYYYYGNSGQKFIGGSASAYGATYTTNDVVGVALDMDAGTLTFYKNNTSQGTATTGLSGDFFPAFSNGGGPTPSWSAALNFGQRPFAYTPPTGFKALNTQNLPDATIKKGNAYFDATTYTGNGVDGRAVSGLGFQPDLVWVKNRNSAAYYHTLIDAVRGADRNIWSNSAAAEQLSDPNGSVGSFVSNGFTAKAGTTSIRNTNGSAEPYVAWQWKESTSAGFDIVTYSGTGASQNINHSLGVAPAMMIIKRRNGNGDWAVYHKSYGPSGGSQLDLTTAFSSIPAYFGGVGPTSTVFTVNTANDVNASGGTYVAYLFAEVAGFSKFGSYTGNGSADGPFVYLGFRPKFVMVKRTDAAGEPWAILDTARDTINASGLQLKANASDAEDDFRASFPIDFTSNGFKIRNTGTRTNASGGTYIFAAFAENPFKNSLAR